MSGGLRRRDLLAAGGALGAGVLGAELLAPGSASATGPDPAEPTGPYYYRRAAPGRPRRVSADVCVYGATSAGVIAAVTAAGLGRSVVLLAFGRHVGGITASGLGATDVGVSAAIGGLARQFYERVGAHYGAGGAQFTVEPHVAEQIFEDWLVERHVTVYRDQHLVRVRRRGGRLGAIELEGGLAVTAAQYVDATYEGDLMAAAGVRWTVGREANAVYGETWDGYHLAVNHQFKVPVDPYRTPGDPASGLLPLVSSAAPGVTGGGDRRVQAYNFRLCLTRAADRLPWPKPAGYRPDRYELLRRYLDAGVFDVFGNNRTMPYGKTDLNNNGAVATDFVGGSDGWPTGSYRERERIFQRHLRYQQGLLYFLANDPGVSAEVRTAVAAWGLPADEFTGTGGWPHELYVREGRRMISDYVVTEHDCLGRVVADDPVGLASYTMDAHNAQRIVVDGRPRNEGDVETHVPGPWPVSYRSIVPRAADCTNLTVPVAMSASHIGYGSVRMEPVFMILGQAAGTAAAQAIAAGTTVQELDYPTLRAQLLADGALLTWPVPAGPLSLVADRAVEHGDTATATAALRNTTAEPLTGVTLALTAPGWTIAATTPTTFDTVPPGEGVAASWHASPPGSDDALRRATLTATGAGHSATATVYVESPVAPPYRTFAGTQAYFGQHGDTLAVAAAGSDLWTHADEYGAIYRPAAAGPGATLTVRVASQEATSPDARAGLMLRDDVTGAGASGGYVVLAVKPSGNLLLLWDADGDGYVESVARADAGTSGPVWLRLTRTGTGATGAYSTDGTSWRPVGTATVPRAADEQDAAVFVTAHDPSVGLVGFDGFAVTG